MSSLGNSLTSLSKTINEIQTLLPSTPSTKNISTSQSLKTLVPYTLYGAQQKYGANIVLMIYYKLRKNNIFYLDCLNMVRTSM